MNYFDAHNHLQDERFAGAQEKLLGTAVANGVRRMVVNGSCEEDWSSVLALAKQNDVVLPSLGFHPWYVPEQLPGWLDRLDTLLQQNPGTAVGEIGLDRWMLNQSPVFLSSFSAVFTQHPPTSIKVQAETFIAQLELAARHHLTASIHCLQAWGLLEELLRRHRRPHAVVLHSYGGPAEMIPGLAKLGAYFSFPGYFLHDRKARHLEAFRAVPRDRLLIETDAPDQLPPERWMPFPLENAVDHKALNHPANLVAIYAGLAEYLAVPLGELTAQVEANFRIAFGTG